MYFHFVNSSKLATCVDTSWGHTHSCLILGVLCLRLCIHLHGTSLFHLNLLQIGLFLLDGWLQLWLQHLLLLHQGWLQCLQHNMDLSVFFWNDFRFILYPWSSVKQLNKQNLSMKWLGDHFYWLIINVFTYRRCILPRKKIKNKPFIDHGLHTIDECYA